MEAPRIVDAEPAHKRQRLLVLDTLGDRLLPEPAREFHHCSDQLLVGGIVLELAHELGIDLEVLPIRISQRVFQGFRVEVRNGDYLQS